MARHGARRARHARPGRDDRLDRRRASSCQPAATGTRASGSWPHDGTELSRQRFAFALDDGGISEGQVEPLLNPGAGHRPRPRHRRRARARARARRRHPAALRAARVPGGADRRRDGGRGLGLLIGSASWSADVRIRRTAMADARPHRPRHPPAPDARPARQRHRSVQLPLRLLHAARGVRAGPRLPAARRDPGLRGDRTRRPRGRRARGAQGPAHRRRAARAARPRGAGRAPRADRRHRRPDADDERLAARGSRRSTGRGRARTASRSASTRSTTRRSADERRRLPGVARPRRHRRRGGRRARADQDQRGHPARPATSTRSSTWPSTSAAPG